MKSTSAARTIDRGMISRGKKNFCNQNIPDRTERDVCDNDIERCWYYRQTKERMDKYFAQNNIFMTRSVEVIKE